MCLLLFGNPVFYSPCFSASFMHHTSKKREKNDGSVHTKKPGTKSEPNPSPLISLFDPICVLCCSRHSVARPYSVFLKEHPSINTFENRRQLEVFKTGQKRICGQLRVYRNRWFIAKVSPNLKAASLGIYYSCFFTTVTQAEIET